VVYCWRARLLRTGIGRRPQAKTTFFFNADHYRIGIHANATNSGFAATDDMADHGALASVAVTGQREAIAAILRDAIRKRPWISSSA
jgi:hypothetical protein